MILNRLPSPCADLRQTLTEPQGSFDNRRVI